MTPQAIMIQSTHRIPVDPPLRTQIVAFEGSNDQWL
jgi:hypothetical protein